MKMSYTVYIAILFLYALMGLTPLQKQDLGNSFNDIPWGKSSEDVIKKLSLHCDKVVKGGYKEKVASCYGIVFGQESSIVLKFNDAEELNQVWINYLQSYDEDAKKLYHHAELNEYSYIKSELTKEYGKLNEEIKINDDYRKSIKSIWLKNNSIIRLTLAYMWEVDPEHGITDLKIVLFPNDENFDIETWRRQHF